MLEKVARARENAEEKQKAFEKANKTPKKCEFDDFAKKYNESYDPLNDCEDVTFIKMFDKNRRTVENRFYFLFFSQMGLALWMFLAYLLQPTEEWIQMINDSYYLTMARYVCALFLHIFLNGETM